MTFIYNFRQLPATSIALFCNYILELRCDRFFPAHPGAWKNLRAQGLKSLMVVNGAEAVGKKIDKKPINVIIHLDNLLKD